MLSEDLQTHRAVLPETAADDPLLRLQKETRLGDGVIRLRATTHPEETRIGGILVMCPACGARRDWMVICDRSEMSIQCREVKSPAAVSSVGGDARGLCYPGDRPRSS
ncbi:hypothetical protein PV417_21665 [Streptomyces sp. ME19-03-3]|nr:hypothetical protein [Streptomyces sp. ME19-03-3]